MPYRNDNTAVYFALLQRFTLIVNITTTSSGNFLFLRERIVIAFLRITTTSNMFFIDLIWFAALFILIGFAFCNVQDFAMFEDARNRLTNAGRGDARGWICIATSQSLKRNQINSTQLISNQIKSNPYLPHSFEFSSLNWICKHFHRSSPWM
jgi:hypothetical protein